MKDLNFKHRIELLHTTTTMDEIGQEITKEVSFGSFWAEIKTVRGQDIQSAGQQLTKNTVRFIIRYVPGVNSKMIIVHNGDRYKIEEVLNDNMNNKTLTIVATASI